MAPIAQTSHCIVLLVLAGRPSSDDTEVLIGTGLSVRALQADAKTVQALSQDAPALVVLDGRGLFRPSVQMCRVLKSSPALTDVPLLLWSGAVSEAERVQAFEAGADKVVDRSTLTTTDVTAMLAAPRSPRALRRTISYADIELDLDGYRVCRGQSVIPLSIQQLHLLHLFMEHPERVLTREEIATRLWGRGDIAYDTVRASVQRLRRLLRFGAAPDVIRSVRGRGWSLDATLTGITCHPVQPNATSQIRNGDIAVP